MARANCTDFTSKKRTLCLQGPWVPGTFTWSYWRYQYIGCVSNSGRSQILSGMLAGLLATCGLEFVWIDDLLVLLIVFQCCGFLLLRQRLVSSLCFSQTSCISTAGHCPICIQVTWGNQTPPEYHQCYSQHHSQVHRTTGWSWHDRSPKHLKPERLRIATEGTMNTEFWKRVEVNISKENLKTEDQMLWSISWSRGHLRSRFLRSLMDQPGQQYSVRSLSALLRSEGLDVSCLIVFGVVVWLKWCCVYGVFYLKYRVSLISCLNWFW